MSTRDQLVEALHACLDYVQATSDIDGVWEVASQASLDEWRKAREQIIEVVSHALAAEQAERN